MEPACHHREVAIDLGATGFCGVVLAGGTAARMDGVDKASIELHGRSLLALAVDALVDADEVVVVGPETVRTERPVTFVREDPPLGGPVAGLLTGVDALLRTPRTVAVLAVDMPHVGPHTLRRLREAAEGRDGAFLHGADGRQQLCGVLDADALARVRPGLEEQHGMSVRRLLEGLDLAEVAAHGEEARDVDSWADLRDLADGPP